MQYPANLCLSIFGTLLTDLRRGAAQESGTASIEAFVGNAVQLVVLLLVVFTLANIMLAAVSLPLVPLMHSMRGKDTIFEVRMRLRNI
jgi:hypothetical protein